MSTPTDKVMTDAAEKTPIEWMQSAINALRYELDQSIVEDIQKKWEAAKAYWQQQLSSASSGVGVWVKASERLPNDMDDFAMFHWRYADDHLKLDTDLFENDFYAKILRKINGEGIAPYDEIEWLDESPQSSSMVSEDGEFQRLYEWLMDENRKPAQTFFTSGILRNVAKEIEFQKYQIKKDIQKEQ